MLQNNIAEVEELQPDLLDEDLLEHILSLLQDSEAEVGVRYFAGGILAQLASRPEAWTLSEELLSTILKQLVCVCVEGESFGCWFAFNRQLNSLLAPFNSVFLSWQHTSILTWTQIEREMVSYR